MSEKNVSTRLVATSNAQRTRMALLEWEARKSCARVDTYLAETQRYVRSIRKVLDLIEERLDSGKKLHRTFVPDFESDVDRDLRLRELDTEDQEGREQWLRLMK